jgi:hypothetical protein
MGLSGEADLRAEPPAAGLEFAATSVLLKRFGAKRHENESLWPAVSNLLPLASH